MNTCAGPDQYVADSITVTVGNNPGTVADLQTLFDGNVFHVDEVAGTPGTDLYVEFVDVTDFDYVQIIGYYAGAATHATSIELHDWDSGLWARFHSMINCPASGNWSFYVPCPSNYIGTGADAGMVRVRFNHAMMGNGSHDLYLDVVCLYNQHKYLEDLITIASAAAQEDIVNVYNEQADANIDYGSNVVREERL